MTLTWGFGLIAECAAASALTFVLPVSQFMVVSPILSWGAIGLITAWTIWYAKRTISKPLNAATDAAERSRP